MDGVYKSSSDMNKILRNKPQGQEYCDGTTFWCDKGHCCGKGKCCSYYYELWWFWLIWALIILLSCCCLYQQKRFRHRRESTRRTSRRSRSRSRFIRALDPTIMSLFDFSRVRLPTYDEAKDMPKDPPPYSAVSENHLPQTTIGGPPPTIMVQPRHINETPQARLIDNEEPSDGTEQQWREPPPPYTASCLPPTLVGRTQTRSPSLSPSDPSYTSQATIPVLSMVTPSHNPRPSFGSPSREGVTSPAVMSSSRMVGEASCHSIIPLPINSASDSKHPGTSPVTSAAVSSPASLSLVGNATPVTSLPGNVEVTSPGSATATPPSTEPCLTPSSSLATNTSTHATNTYTQSSKQPSNVSTRPSNPSTTSSPTADANQASTKTAES